MSEEKEQFFYNCPICKSDSAFIFITKHSRKIYECANKKCGHFFTPILKEAQGVCVREEDIERESDESLKSFNERNIRLLNLFRSYLVGVSSPITFLDFGAGNAHISRTFKRELGDDSIIFCLEPNPLCKGLYEKYGLIQIKNIEDLPNEINFIYMIEVIEHLEDPTATLLKLKSCLTKDGTLFISTPLGSSKEKSTNAYDTPSHLHFFSHQSLNLTFSKAGFKTIEYKLYPEMYPISKNPIVRIFKKIKFKVKQLINSIKKIDKITHLVGFTKQN